MTTLGSNEHNRSNECDNGLRSASKKLALTKLVVFAEQLLPYLVLPISIASLFIALAWLGFYSTLPIILRVSVVFALIFSFLYSLIKIFRISIVDNKTATFILEEKSGSLHQPLQVQSDLVDSNDPFAMALWAEHQKRMVKYVADLDPPSLAPDISGKDRYALRALPVLLLAIAFGYSYSNNAGSIKDAFDFTSTANSQPNETRIDAWLTPPDYTGQPPIYLSSRNISRLTSIDVPINSLLTVQVGQRAEDNYVVFETSITAESIDLPADMSSTDDETSDVASYSATIADAGILKVNDYEWQLNLIKDHEPSILFDGLPKTTTTSALDIKFSAKDDYGVVKAYALITPLDIKHDAIPLYPPPEFTLNVPRRNNNDFTNTTSKNISDHPIAGSKVSIQLVAVDGAGQIGMSPPHEMLLPSKTFSEPLAGSAAEQRQILSLDVRQLRTAVDFNEAITLRPEDTIPNLTHYLLMKSAQMRMKMIRDEQSFKDTADYLWEIALGIEDGTLSQAQQRVKQAQKNLEDALNNNAPSDEIEKHIQELRAAMDELMRELSSRAMSSDQGQQAQNSLRQSDLNNMMQQLENMARMGNRDAAKEMLQELQRMMNNMQAGKPADSNNGQAQRGQSPIQQELNKLGEIMQKQQSLLDETFKQDQALRDHLQRNEAPLSNEEQITRDQLRDSLKQLETQQKDLSTQLGDLQSRLKDLGMPLGDGFSTAEREMKGAGEALGRNNGRRATEHQSEALNALRQGTQGMMQQMLQAMRDGQSENGQGDGSGQPQTKLDPLGRPMDMSGDIAIPDETDVQRMREILNQIGEKLGAGELQEIERRYLERLIGEEN